MGRFNAKATDIDYIVNDTNYEMISVLITYDAISIEVVSRMGFEIKVCFT
jgi:hypothetical protein